MIGCGRRLGGSVYTQRTRIPLSDQQGSSVTSCLFHILCPGHLKSFTYPRPHALSHPWSFPHTLPLLACSSFPPLTSNHNSSPNFYLSFSPQTKYSFFQKSFPSLLIHRWGFGGLGHFLNRPFLLSHGFVPVYPPLDSRVRRTYHTCIHDAATITTLSSVLRTGPGTCGILIHNCCIYPDEEIRMMFKLYVLGPIYGDNRIRHLQEIRIRKVLEVTQSNHPCGSPTTCHSLGNGRCVETFQ